MEQRRRVGTMYDKGRNRKVEKGGREENGRRYRCVEPET